MENLTISFDATAFSRKKITALISNLSNDQLTTIPHGLDHNIIWHIGHIIVMQQIFLYVKSEQPPFIKSEIIGKYKVGSTASTNVDSVEIDYIKDQLMNSLAQVVTDYKSGLFKTFNGFTTKADVTINNIEDAINFHTFHEGLHLGRIMEIKKLVQ